MTPNPTSQPSCNRGLKKWVHKVSKRFLTWQDSRFPISKPLHWRSSLNSPQWNGAKQKSPAIKVHLKLTFGYYWVSGIVPALQMNFPYFNFPWAAFKCCPCMIRHTSKKVRVVRKQEEKKRISFKNETNSKWKQHFKGIFQNWSWCWNQNWIIYFRNHLSYGKFNAKAENLY